MLDSPILSMVSSQAVCDNDDANGCNTFALYVVFSNDTLYDIATRFGLSSYLPLVADNNITNANDILDGQVLRVPFTCGCPGKGGILGHNFSYSVVQGDQDNTIAAMYYSNLTTTDAIDSTNAGSLDVQYLIPGDVLLIPVNCSCGDPSVSKLYGLFGTYATQQNDTLSSLSSQYNISERILQGYNPTISFEPRLPFTIMFIPLKNASGQYPPFISSAKADYGGGSSSQGTILGAAVGGVVLCLGLGLGILWFLCHRCRVKRGEISSFASELKAVSIWNDHPDTWINEHGAFSPDSCINFSFQELMAATNNFNIENAIGQGGYGTVYYGEWQGRRLAVKRMDMSATKEFVNELKVLSSVHHANLVHLLGYCTKSSLFLVYEYVDNGNLSQHLRLGTTTNYLPWTTRVRIALDAARGIQYLHDYTRPSYIHLDLKPSNILIDKNFHAKVGDFGITKLMNPDWDGSIRTNTLRGTPGYIPIEYAQNRRISVKVDVYAFGVILFQLISGREAITQQCGPLVDQFEEILGKPDAEGSFESLIDPALGNDFPLESAWKMVMLASRCTDRKAEQRPSMREVVLELTMFSHADDTL